MALKLILNLSLMNRSSLLIFLIFVSNIAFLSSCENTKDEYYQRPEWLEPPIYQQLEDAGLFSSYLECVEIAGYSKTFKGAGYITVFAPTDEAFKTYLQQKGVSAVSSLDPDLIKGIVSYSIVSNAYSKDLLDDYQSTKEQAWIPDIAFKRQTQYFKWVYDEDYEGGSRKVFDIPATAAEAGFGVSLSSNDNNYKNIPFFTNNFMATEGISSYDYNYFYPDATFTGFNVEGAQVTGGDLRAENGFIHIIDKVIEPLPNINELIDRNQNYSMFKFLLDEYMRTYALAPSNFLNRYRLVSGTADNVYFKYYPQLNFSPNCENYLRYGGGEMYDAQIDGWSMFVPNDQAMQRFYDEKFLKYYNNLENVPNNIIAELLNAHMFKNMVWPSKFDNTLNPFGEPARFDPDLNIVEKKIASNGLFYGTNEIQKTNSFYTLMGELFLNPNYSLMLQALITTEVQYEVRNPKSSITFFLIPNQAFVDAGFEYNSATRSWSLTHTRMGTNPSAALKRFVDLHVISHYDNQVPPRLTGKGVLKTNGGEYINYYRGLTWGVGNSRLAEYPIATANDTTPTNGESYILTKALQFADDEIGIDIMLNNNYSVFAEYLKWASFTLPGYLYDEPSFKLTNFDKTKFNTLLVPSNDAMNQAIEDGVLPKIGFNPFTEEELNKVANFIWYHCLYKKLVIPGMEGSGKSRTLYQTVDGPTYVTVINSSVDEVQFEDSTGKRVSIIPSKSTVLANRAVIHILDGYLNYE